MKVSALKSNKANPRHIKGEKLDLLKKSVASFQKMMELRPIVVDQDNVVLGGNMRLAAIKAMGMKDIPDEWVRKAELTEDEKREFIIKDNAGFGEWDWDILANEWDAAELTEWGLDVPDFEAVEPEGDADAEPQIDKAAELNKKWKVKSGDLWQIGEHRLLCGDSTKDVERLLDGGSITLTVSSPPYFNQRQYSQWESYEDYCGFISLIAQQIGKHSAAISAVFWNVGMDGESGRDMPGDHSNLFCEAGFRFIDSIAWVKESATWTNPRSQHISAGHYYPALQWEPCLVFYRDKLPSFDVADAKAVREYQTNVWSLGKVIGSEQAATGHTAMFPTELATRAARAYSKRGDVVYEPFAGSGTTLVACQNLNRKCYAIEISENYCAVILERMAAAFPELEIKRVEAANG